MAKVQNKMRLGAFFNPTGHHVASWRHEESQADAGINIAHYRELAQTAERAKFDMIFLAGPGHGAPGVLGPVYLEGAYSEIYPDKSEDAAGLRDRLAQRRRADSYFPRGHG